jgi:hypothetical protein
MAKTKPAAVVPDAVVAMNEARRFANSEGHSFLVPLPEVYSLEDITRFTAQRARETWAARSAVLWGQLWVTLYTPKRPSRGDGHPFPVALLQAVQQGLIEGGIFKDERSIWQCWSRRDFMEHLPQPIVYVRMSWGG